jgi:hypothetical protein
MEIKLNRKILIMGLPGSGKTTLAELLVPKLKAVWFNADAVRSEISTDLGFTPEDRLEHSRRMGKMCEFASKYGTFSVADFVCPTAETRKAFNADITIWVNRIEEGRFEDTNKMFEKPENYDIELTDGTPEEWLQSVMSMLTPELWDNQAPTALLIGRYQPFHIGHKKLVEEALRRSGQCCLALRDVGGLDESNPYDFNKVKLEIEAACTEFGNKIKVVELPNISDVFYGRGVGYNIEEIELSKDIQAVSATKIRKGEIDQQGQEINTGGHNPFTKEGVKLK